MNRKTLSGLSETPVERIRFYTERGLITVRELRTGRGRERDYSTENFFELMLIKELAQYGVGLDRVAYILEEARKRSLIFKPEAHESPAQKYIWVSKDDVVFGQYTPDDQGWISIRMKEDPSVLLINTSKIWAFVKASV